VIIAIDARWIFPEISGIGAYTRELIRALARVDRENEYLLLFADDALRDAAMRRAEAGDRFRPLRFPHGVFAARSQIALPRLLARHGVEVYHAPNYMIPYLAFPRRRRGRTACVVTIHDVIPMLFPEHAPRARKARLYPLYRRLMLETGARADAIITVSERSRADVIRALRIPESSASKVVKVFNGVSETFRPPPGRGGGAAAFGPGRPARLLYVGRADPYKNLTGLLRAVARARGLCPFPLELRIVGPRDPRYPEAPRLAAELGLEAIARWTGFLDDGRLLAEYQRADLLMQPSKYEGFGLPVVEAMACGVPVICGNAGSLPEIAGGAAVLVDPDDVEGIAAAIGRVLGDPALAADLAARGVRRAAEFTWERAAAETLEVYRRVAS